ncbi:MAG: spermine synthase, partial [Chloroflexia bacterium]
MIVLSHYELRPILETYRQTTKQNTPYAILSTHSLSPDLGLTHISVQLTDHGITFPTGETVSWHAVEEIVRQENKCFYYEDDGLTEIRVFSEVTGRVCSLYPTGGAPTMVIGGFSMHRIKNSDPHADTLEKIKAASPIAGRVLDTTTGLGYTAI